MIRVDVVSGFLGVGKTTLIKKILKACCDEKVVLIENEFGKIGIDGELIKDEGFKVYELSNGCLCCTMKYDFVDLVDNIINECNPERILIEPTGVNILSEIISVLKSKRLKDKCQINSLITVLDCESYLEHIDAFGTFFTDQIENANILMLSKVQLVNDETIEKIIDSVRRLNKVSTINRSPWDDLSDSDIKNIIGIKNKHKTRIDDLLFSKNVSHTNDNIESMSIEVSRKFTEEILGNILKELKSPKCGNIIRAKGFVNSFDGYLEFSYSSGKNNIFKYSGIKDGKVTIIGLNLENKVLKELFN